jgi:hypothetical protein
MTGQINTLTAQATIDERHRSAARARSAATDSDAVMSRSRRRRPALIRLPRLVTRAA